MNKCNDQLKDIQDRLRNLILNTCNKIGCESCGLSWVEDGREKCSATELQGKEFELKEYIYANRTN